MGNGISWSVYHWSRRYWSKMMTILLLMVTFLCVLCIFYYKWKRPLENSTRRLLQIKLRTCGGRLRTCVLYKKMEISDTSNYRNKRPSDKLYYQSGAGNLWKTCVCWSHIKFHVICQMLTMSFIWQYVHIEALWQSVPFVACRQSVTGEVTWVSRLL